MDKLASGFYVSGCFLSDGILWDSHVHTYTVGRLRSSVCQDGFDATIECWKSSWAVVSLLIMCGLNQGRIFAEEPFWKWSDIIFLIHVNSLSLFDQGRHKSRDSLFKILGTAPDLHHECSVTFIRTTSFFFLHPSRHGEVPGWTQFWKL